MGLMDQQTRMQGLSICLIRGTIVTECSCAGKKRPVADGA